MTGFLLPASSESKPTTSQDTTTTTVVADSPQATAPNAALFGKTTDGNQKGKGGTVYNQHYGFCMETQYSPDSPDQARSPSKVLQSGQTLHSTTIYKFGVRE